MIKLKCIAATIVLLVATYGGKAQTASAAGSAAVADPSPSSTAWKIGPFDVNGKIDAYYSLGFNHAAARTNALRNFDDRAGKVELNMASLTVDYSPKPLGFHLDVGAGRAFDIMGAAEKDVTQLRFFEQAYIDVKPAP